MDEVIQALHSSDFCSVFFIMCVLLLAGRMMSSTTPDAERLSARVGYAVFLAYCVFAFSELNVSSSGEIAAIIVRALIYAGIGFGAALCVTPAIIAIRRREEMRRNEREQRRYAKQRQREREDEEQERRERDVRDAERRRIQAEVDAKYRAEAEARQRVDKERLEKEKARIAQACSRCELLFNLYKADIESRFTREMLDDFMKKYMHAGEPAETVERRADELCAIMERHREIVKGKSQPTTIMELSKWFAEQQQLIEQSPAPADIKENQVVMLSMRYEKLFEEIMRKAQP